MASDADAGAALPTDGVDLNVGGGEGDAPKKKGCC